MDKNKIIDGCIKVEKSAAAIYNKLILLFPDKKEFWKGLFDDEVEHMSFLNDVKTLGLISNIEKIDFLPSKPVINNATKLAENVMDTVTKGSLAFDDALAITLQLEQAMVETYTNHVIAQLISCDESRAQKVMHDEKRHIDAIIRMMKTL